MITKYVYETLKVFKNSPDGFTQKEYDELDLFAHNHVYLRLSSLLDKGYIEQDILSIKKFKTWKFVITQRGIDAINFYEKWLNYPYTCEHQSGVTGVKYVIVERRSGCFATGEYHMDYTSNLGFTKDFSRAKLYNTHEDAEKELANAIKDSPTKYQNAEDYDFSIEEVKISTNIELPKTFICKDCGKVYPIEKYNISMCCPQSWNTGVCINCIGTRKQKEHEAIYGRNKRGVFDYDSID